nr:GYD domain-containing protein [Bradyrhizobium ivorense]
MEAFMHFCMTGQYTPRALNAILENPTTNRQEAARKLIESAGGKLVSMYSTATDGPGVLVIFDVPDPSAAPAISGLTVAAGTMQNVKLMRLFTQDEIKQVRQNAAKLRPSYSPPGS